ncbi:alpha/beta hydrolase [Mesorhizobium sp. BR1-1-9]|uniref:alpha/beta fold hydrolase n=1 Tax=unclassified Mesorhizobium TaxID=325217 RepID=UPI001127DED3|nr:MULTISPECIES: alpha/beta hydrolase [unclassified Mesorhizobium]MBZ9808705.1 alpha/beta hydrolase [Mesorhizobium sp. ESP-6-2]MBZ9874898.1 alpha/beta hydrolase [Mesorhizobium sp. BR1-1-9]MBZ9941591.1 alpha/beta hydrolase [Mesorhizobium sp. BR1-1-13]TPM33187.1 alpha/beta hydrolase [Mesorhizobium sp. B2-2-2]
MASERFSDFFYTAPDGLKLHARIYGEANSGHWPVVCLPGLTRNARDFHELALYLAGKAGSPRKVVAFDYRGRGQSDYDPDVSRYTVGVEADDILAGLAALGIEEAAFIGTSRGGLIIHVLGALRPAILKAIVLNDIGPVIEPAGLALIQSYLEREPKPKTFAEAVAAQRRIHGRDFSALTDADWERMVLALYRETDQGLLPDFDPKLVDTVANLDLTQPLPALWPQFDALSALPMLAIRGANSSLLSVDTQRQMREHHPAMQTITVEGQGHAPFLETGTLPGDIAAFLDRAERLPTRL